MQNHMVLARLGDLRTRLDLGDLPPLVHRCSSGLSREDKICVGNDDAQPEAVVPRELKFAASGSRLSHTFPKSSVTRIELR